MPEAAVQVVQRMSFADSDIIPPASTWVFSTLGIMTTANRPLKMQKRRQSKSLGFWTFT
jgi:elongation factor 1-gamma